ncbi:MAG TPA: DNA gyrase inhibitor YacG [Steroidobacteraceae bacterium]|nr:DNA gyrase inhibitor YacG [Steroidobacteraceae bacterium]
MNAAQHRCPTCGRAIEWSDQFPHRPFCSDRCRLVDLGGWLSGERAIPGDSADLTDDAPSSPSAPRDA